MGGENFVLTIRLLSLTFNSDSVRLQGSKVIILQCDIHTMLENARPKKILPGQKVIIISREDILNNQFSTEGIAAMGLPDDMEIAAYSQQSRRARIHVGSIGTVIDYNKYYKEDEYYMREMGDKYTKVLFGNGEYIDFEKGSVEALTFKNFFTFVIPGMLGLRG